MIILKIAFLSAQISHLFEKSAGIVKRNTSVCFYDCTNYYFEIEEEDDDYVDEVTGETLKGLRKYAVSKEHRPNPVAQMGLFMDSDGIPLSMCITSGSDNEQTTAIPLEKKLVQIRNRQIERARKILARPDPETYKKGPHDVTRFIKRVSCSQTDGKIKDSYEIDLCVIEEEEKYDGFYAVATNLDDDAETILGISSNRYKIEECFRIMKTNFSARPAYHQKSRRITVHFMICYTALLIYRLLETKLNRYGTHFTVEVIIKTLNNMEVANIEDMCYMSTYSSLQVCTALNAVFGLGLDKKYYQPKELNKKIRKISK